MPDLDGPPPLVSSSSDEVESECRWYDDPLSSGDNMSSNDDGRDSWRPPAQRARPRRPGPAARTNQAREAAEFCLAEMKQTQSGLQVGGNMVVMYVHRQITYA